MSDPATSSTPAAESEVKPRPRRVVNLKNPKEIQNLEDEARRREESSTLEEELMSTEEEQSFRELQEVLRSNDLIGGSARISRRGPTDSAYAYIGKINTNQFDIEQIKKVYGGGDYSIQFFRSNGQIARRIQFSIDPRFKGSMDVSSLPLSAQNEESSKQSGKMMEMLAAAVIADKKKDPAEANLMQAMMKAQQDNSNLLVTMMMKSSETQMHMMSAMMAAMASAFGAKNSASQGIDFKDILALMPLLKGDGAKQPSLLELTQAMRNLKELTESGGEGGEGDSPKTTLDKIISIVPHVAETVKALRGGGSAPAPAAAALPAATGTAEGGPAQPAAPVPVSAAGQSDLEASLQLVVAGARRKSEVGLYHDILMDNITDEQVPMLKEILTQDSWFSTLFGKLPDADQLKPWLTHLRNLTLETLAPPAGAEAAPVHDGNGTGQPDSAGIRSGQDTARVGEDS